MMYIHNFEIPIHELNRLSPGLQNNRTAEQTSRLEVVLPLLTEVISQSEMFTRLGRRRSRPGSVLLLKFYCLCYLQINPIYC